jgi:outer membrane protein assembly factor BamE (lipoprotein component of BamABCDE complex)
MASHPVPVNARARRPARLATAALLLALGGCALFDTPTVDRGQKVDPEDLRQITVGVSTQADVTALLGSPSARGTFDSDHWYYISGVTRTRPGRTTSVLSQRVVAITFNGNGVVQKVEELTESDARSVQMVQRETPVPGTERTLMQTLFGNIGRLGPGGGGAQGGTGGTTGR